MAAVQKDKVEVRTEAANRYLTTLTIGPVDGDPRDTLERFRKVRIGELAHVFIRDGVHNPLRITLDVGRFCEASPNPLNGDRFLPEFFTVCHFLCICRMRQSER